MGALLAGSPPRLAERGTTEQLGTDDPDQLPTTHVVGDLGETWPSPEVCNKRLQSKGVFS